MKPSPALSIQKNMKATLQGRTVGILIADGSDPTEVAAVQKAVGKAGGKCKIVALKVGGAKMLDGTVLKPDGQLAGSPSQIFDAVAVVLSEKGCEALMREAAAVQFVMDLSAISKESEQTRLRCRCSKRPASGLMRASPALAKISSRLPVNDFGTVSLR
jgi:catalase